MIKKKYITPMARIADASLRINLMDVSATGKHVPWDDAKMRNGNFDDDDSTNDFWSTKYN